MISINSLTKRYGAHTALDNVSLEIFQGDIFAVLGPNGSGKSTLFGCMSGLIRPDSGSILISNEPVTRNSRTVNQKVSYLPQVVHFEGSFKGKEIVEFYDKIRRNNGRMEPLWSHGELDELMNRKTGEYSKGMAQRLSLLLALRYDVPVYFLDEPTAHLDYEGVVRLRQYLKQIHSQAKTIVLSSHIYEDCEYLAGKICYLKRGVVQSVKTINEYDQDKVKKSELYIHLKVQNDRFIEVCKKNGADNARYEGDFLVFWASAEKRLPLLHTLEKNGAEILNIGAKNGKTEVEVRAKI